MRENTQDSAGFPILFVRNRGSAANRGIECCECLAISIVSYEGEHLQLGVANNETALKGRKGNWMKPLMILMCVLAVLVAMAAPSYGAVDWKGLTWTVYGANTTAVVNVDGGLDITVLGGQSGDPGNDNWVLHSLLPTNLIQANGPWVEFKIKDTYAGDADVGGPRGFVDTDINGWTTETMWQGGIYAEYPNYYLNHNVYDFDSGGWANDPNDWYTGPVRTAGEHVVKFGMGPGGDVDMWFDGVLGQTISASADCTFFKRMYLGVTTVPGTTFTATYNDLSWGTGYVNVPEPATLIIWSLLGAMGLVVGWRRSRKAG